MNKVRTSSRTPKNKKTIEEVVPKYCLVIYDDFKTGVILTQDIAKTLQKQGKSVQAPAPIDWPAEALAQCKKNFKAKVVEFGHNVDYLYSLSVTKEGKIVPNPKEEEESSLAKRKEANSVLKQQLSDKDKNLIDLTEFVSNLIPIDPVEEQVLYYAANNDSEGKGSSQNNVTSLINLQNCPETQKSIPGVNVSSRNSETLDFNARICPQTHENIPKAGGSSSASLNDLQDCMRNLHNVSKAKGSSNAISTSSLECCNPGPNKFRLVAGRDVYLDKIDYMSLPAIIGEKVQKDKDSELDNKLEPKKKKQKKNSSVTPKKLTTIIINFIVPKDILKNITASDLPLQVIEAIRGYMNCRLPDTLKETDSSVREYISDYTRSLRRDRTLENLKRKSKKEQEKLLLQKRT